MLAVPEILPDISPCFSVLSGMWASEPKSHQHFIVIVGVPNPPNILSLPDRALDPLTPRTGRGRSPLHCQPIPWPGGRGSHHSALLSCPGSSLAQRWSALSHGGSAGTENRGRPSGAQLEVQEPLLPTPAPPLSSLQSFGKGQQAPETLQEVKKKR